MKKIPKLQRAKRGKKYIGSYFVMVDGERVNLDTKNATLALERAKDAARGVRNFQSDHDAAADVTEEEITRLGQPAAATPSPPPPAPPPAAPLELAPIPAPPTTPAPPPPADDPPQGAAGDWAADAQAAAQETKQQSDSAAPAADGVKVQIDPNVIKQLCKTLATWTVEAQLMLQAQAVRWKTGTAPPPLDVFFEAHPKAPAMMVDGVKQSKELAVTCWTQFFERKFPVDNIPDWAGAMILTGGLVSMQYVAAKITEEEKKKGAGGPAPRQPADVPVGADPDGHGSENGAGAEAL